MCDIDLNSLLSLRGDALTVTRGHQYKVTQEHCTNNCRKTFLEQRVQWPRFGTAFRYYNSFTRFKLSLNNVNLCIFTRFKVYMFSSTYW